MLDLIDRRVLLLALGGGAAFVGFLLTHRPAPVTPPGHLPQPVQDSLAVNLDLPAPPGYRISATDTYWVQAMIVGRERYFMDGGAVLSPVDFALAWGPLVLPPYIDTVTYSQGGRWYRYRWPGGVSIDPRVIRDNSANTHIILPPEDEALRSTVLSFGVGDIVQLSGYLVRVSGPQGYTWNSSRSRTDSDDGSCEVFYVTAASRTP